MYLRAPAGTGRTISRQLSHGAGPRWVSRPDASTDNACIPRRKIRMTQAAKPDPIPTPGQQRAYLVSSAGSSSRVSFRVFAIA